MGPLESTLLKTASEAIVEPSKGFITKVFGPAMEEVGLILGEKIKLRRLRNELRILKKAEELLDEAGLEPKAIPLRLLVPLLEHCSLEDDEPLQNMWAALIANESCQPSGAAGGFVEVLRQLSPREAKLLNGMWEVHGESRVSAQALEDAYTKLGLKLHPNSLFVLDHDDDDGGGPSKRQVLNSEDFQLAMSNLKRLGVLESYPSLESVKPTSLAQQEQKKKWFSTSDPPQAPQQQISFRYSYTPFGKALVKACTRPCEVASKFPDKFTGFRDYAGDD